MWQVIKEIFSLLPRKSKRNFVLLIILTFLMSIFEIIGLALILPFLFLVGNLKLIETNQHIHSLYTFLGFHDKLDFLYFIGGGAMTFSLLGVILSIFTNIKLTKFSNNLGSAFSIKLLKYYTKHQESLNMEHRDIRKQILTEPAVIATNIILPSLMILSKTILVLVLFAVLMVINYKVTILFSLLLFTIYFIIFRFSNAKVQHNKKQIETLREERSLLVNTILSHKKKLDKTEENELLQSYSMKSSELSGYQSFNNVIAKLPRYLMMFIIFSSVVFVSSYLVTTYQGNMDDIMHKMLLYIVLGLKTLPQIQNIFINYLKLKSNLASFSNIRQELFSTSK